MSSPEAPKILCVDDESRVLEGLALHLRRDYQVHTALSGDEALKKLKELGTVAVIVSDMRMPSMDGATLLHHVMRTYPDTTRILLTGEAGRDAAVSAVNDGQIFRFLTKPCPPERLKTALEAAVGQHRLVIAEREILQKTLIGCIKALVDVLAITNPVAFGRASRVKRMAMEFAHKLECKGFWQLEAAALLSQLGYLSLPVELVEKLYYGERLTSEEKTLSEGVPKVAGKLLGHIPRLEPVLQILKSANAPAEPAGKPVDNAVQLGTRILGLVLDYDSLVAQGHEMDVALKMMRAKGAQYDATLLEKFASHLGSGSGASEVRELPLRLVQPGMTLLQDLRTHMGTLLVPKGFEITTTFLERLHNFGGDMLAEKVQVIVPSGVKDGLVIKNS